MKNFILKASLYLIAFFLIASCTQYKQVACPDFSKNRSYTTDSKRKNFEKHNYKTKQISFRNKKRKNTKDLHIASSEQKNSSRINNEIPNENPFSINPINKDILETKQLDNKKNNQNEKPEDNNLLASSDKNIVVLKKQNIIPAAKIENNINPDELIISRKEKKEFKKNFKKDLNELKKNLKEDKPAQGMAIASLVLGILGLFIFGFIAGILAIIFGGIALKRIKANPDQPGRGLAIAGLILGIIDVALLLILIAAVGAALV